MKPIGVDLAEIAKGPKTDWSEAPRCPGAMVRVTRGDLSGLIAGGERFLDDHRAIPRDGYGSARAYCTNFVAQVPEREPPLFYGLCSSCQGLEENNRDALRARAKLTNKGAT